MERKYKNQNIKSHSIRKFQIIELLKINEAYINKIKLKSILRNFILVITQLFLMLFSNSLRSQSDTLLKNSDYYFDENLGQVFDTANVSQPQILFSAKINNINAFFEKNCIHFISYQSDFENNIANATSLNDFHNKINSSTISRQKITLQFINANSSCVVSGNSPSSYSTTVITPDIPNGINGINSYKKIIYHNIYNNIDLEIFENNKNFKFQFIVNPGGVVSDIKYKYINAGAPSLSANVIKILTPMLEIKEQDLIASQSIEGVNNFV